MMGELSTSQKAMAVELVVVPKPDLKEWQTKINAEIKSIEDTKAQLAKIAPLILKNSGIKKEYRNHSDEIRERISEIHNQIDALEEEKRKLLENISFKNKEDKDMRANLSSLQAKYGSRTEEGIDIKINEISRMMQTTTLSLKEEKKVLQKLRELKMAKPVINKYNNMQNSVENFEDGSIGHSKVRLECIRLEIIQQREKRRGEVEKLRALIDQRNKATAPFVELNEQKSKLTEKLNGHIAMKKQYHDDLNAQTKAYDAYLNQLKRIKHQKFLEEKRKKAVEAERFQLEKQLEEVDEVPFTNEIAELLQVSAYLSKLTNTKEDEHVETQNKIGQHISSANKGILNKAEPTEQVLLPKGQREEEYFFAPKKKGNKKTNNDGSSQHKDSKKSKSKGLTHDMAMLVYFDKMKIQPPVILDEIPECLKALERQLVKYKEEQKIVASKSESIRQQIQARIDVLDGKTPKVPLVDSAIEKKDDIEDASESGEFAENQDQNHNNPVDGSTLNDISEYVNRHEVEVASDFEKVHAIEVQENSRTVEAPRELAISC